MPGTRKTYSEEEKAKILAFMDDYNAQNNGRGGATAAAKKFGVSPISIGTWKKKRDGGGSAPKKSPQPNASSGPKETSKVPELPSPDSLSVSERRSMTMMKLWTLSERINRLEEDLEESRREFDELKGTL